VQAEAIVRDLLPLEALEKTRLRSVSDKGPPAGGPAELDRQAALEIFAALWRHAREVDPEFPGDWRTDIEADIRLTRVLNGPTP
jgi:hypothetical protein